jgi:hypothetical protein
LQLAAYVVALFEAGMAIDAALLLSLKPAQLGYSGVSAMDTRLSRRMKRVDDWPAMQESWRQALQHLLTQHLAGDAVLTATPAACRYCHLPAFCRRQAGSDVAPDEEESDE